MRERGALLSAALLGALAHALAEVEDGVDVAGHLKVEGATDNADYMAILHSTECVVRLHATECGRVFAAHDDVVGVFFHQGLEAVAPAVDIGSYVATAGHADDVVDEGVAASREITRGAEAHDIVDFGRDRVIVGFFANLI